MDFATTVEQPNDFKTLLDFYRNNKRRDIQGRFQNAGDHEIFRYWLEAQIWPVLFVSGAVGRNGKAVFQPDLERRIPMAMGMIDREVSRWRGYIRKVLDLEPPVWLEEMGIPSRWVDPFFVRRVMKDAEPVPEFGAPDDDTNIPF